MPARAGAEALRLGPASPARARTDPWLRFRNTTTRARVVDRLRHIRINTPTAGAGALEKTAQDRVTQPGSFSMDDREFYKR